MAKILFIAANEYPNWGGSELLWTTAAAKLEHHGMEIWASVPDWSRANPVVEQVRSAGCRVFGRRNPSLFNRFSRRAFNLRDPAFGHMRSLSKNMDLVVISQGNNLDGVTWMEAAQACGCKYAAIVQLAHDYVWPDDNLAKRLAKAYEGAVRTYFVSEANLDLSRRQFSSPLRNARVIRNPFNVAYDAHPSWPGDPFEALSLACVARLDAGHKGQDLLLQVLGLPHWRQRRIRMSFIGRGGNEQVLRCMANDLKLANIDFVGQSTDIEEVWRNHHALVLPSRCEGMPLVVVEAMLCSRPCVATDVGGTRELIRHGINGFLAKAPTVELIDEAMNCAWNSRERLMQMGEIAAEDVRQWVSEDPSEDFVRELAATIESAL